MVIETKPFLVGLPLVDQWVSSELVLLDAETQRTAKLPVSTDRGMVLDCSVVNESACHLWAQSQSVATRSLLTFQVVQALHIQNGAVVFQK